MGGGMIMLASPSPDYESPGHHREHCSAAARWSAVPYIIDGVLVYVDDIEKHFSAGRAPAIVPKTSKDTGGSLCKSLSGSVVLLSYFGCFE